MIAFDEYEQEMKQKLRLQQALRRVTHLNIDEVVEKYKNSTHRLILLEYDGVCSEFHPVPSEARPTPVFTPFHTLNTLNTH
jgi:trehalose-6-phosphatase